MSSLDDYLFAMMRLNEAEAQKQALKDKLVPQYIKDGLADIDTEFQPVIDQLQAAADLMKQALIKDVLDAGKTLSNDSIMAVYTPAKPKWDSEGLERYAEDHPEIRVLMGWQAPSVRVRVK
jgi:hypothetical protein